WFPNHYISTKNPLSFKISSTDPNDTYYDINNEYDDFDNTIKNRITPINLDYWEEITKEYIPAN
ncbi:MAG: hypothetical protein KUG68_05460, partial [Flavobacteriaceae bacterium]|nr:hypothetical protein [Flavobacteriaceae bacterium]